MDKLQEQKNYLIELKNYIQEITKEARQEKKDVMEGIGYYKSEVRWEKKDHNKDIRYNTLKKTSPVEKIINNTKQSIQNKEEEIKSYASRLGIKSYGGKEEIYKNINSLEKPYTQFTDGMVNKIDNSKYAIGDLQRKLGTLNMAQEYTSSLVNKLNKANQVTELGKYLPEINGLVKLADIYLENSNCDKLIVKEFNKGFQDLNNKLPKSLKMETEQEQGRGK